MREPEGKRLLCRLGFLCCGPSGLLGCGEEQGPTTLWGHVDSAEPAANPLAWRRVRPSAQQDAAAASTHGGDAWLHPPPAARCNPSSTLPKHLPAGHQSQLVPEPGPSSAAATKGQGCCRVLSEGCPTPPSRRLPLSRGCAGLRPPAETLWKEKHWRSARRYPWLRSRQGEVEPTTQYSSFTTASRQEEHEQQGGSLKGEATVRSLRVRCAERSHGHATATLESRSQRQRSPRSRAP